MRPITSSEHRFPEVDRGKGEPSAPDAPLDLKLLGCLCLFAAVGVSVGSVLGEAVPVELFGTVIAPPMTGGLWMLAAALLFATGYGWLFHQGWVWDMTFTALGFLGTGIVMNELTWGVTGKGLALLIFVGLSIWSLLWRHRSLRTQDLRQRTTGLSGRGARSRYREGD